MPFISCFGYTTNQNPDLSLSKFFLKTSLKILLALLRTTARLSKCVVATKPTLAGSATFFCNRKKK